ncbi:MAG: ABC transporter permease [Oscillospiraceae bacterium]|nr:ABC transporter permease [Oscillospiraceae bacterium]
MKNWIQFVAVFIMTVLSVAIYAGMEGVWNGLDYVVQNYYQTANMADARIFSSSINESEIEQIRELHFVDDVSSSMVFSTILDNHEIENSMIRIRTLNIDDRIAIPIVQTGSEIAYNSNNGIWLNTEFAREHSIETGSHIILAFQSFSKEFEVIGLVFSPEYIYYPGSIAETVPNHRRYGYAFISEVAATEFVGGVAHNEVRVIFNDDQNIALDEFGNIFGSYYLDTILEIDTISANQIAKEISQMRIMAQMFSFVFILLALLTMYTTMSRLIRNQTVTIGLLKALGMSNTRIRMHYCLYGIIISLAGGWLGAFLGGLILSPAVIRVKEVTLTLPVWEIRVSYTTYMVMALITVVCLFSCLIASWKRTREMPAVTMRGEAPQRNKKSRRRYECKYELAIDFSFEWQWIFRDIKRAKLRAIIGVIGIVGGLVLLIAGLGFRDSINYSNAYVFNVQYSYVDKLLLNNLTPEDRTLLETQFDDHQWLFDTRARFETVSHHRNGLLRVLDEGDFIRFQDINQFDIPLPHDGVLLNRRFANTLGVERGDQLDIQIIGTRIEFTVDVVDIIYSPAPQGAFMSKDYFESFGIPFLPTAMLLGDSYEDDLLRNIESVQNKVRIVDQKNDMDIMSQSVMTIIALLIMASVILSVVILYNLGALNFVERYREYATMKVLGFYRREITLLMLRETVLTLLVGTAIGIPAGFWFLGEYIAIVAFDTFDWIPSVNTVSLVIAQGVVTLCSIVVTLILGNQIRKINMVEALKSGE